MIETRRKQSNSNTPQQVGIRMAVEEPDLVVDGLVVLVAHFVEPPMDLTAGSCLVVTGSENFTVLARGCCMEVFCLVGVGFG